MSTSATRSMSKHEIPKITGILLSTVAEALSVGVLVTANDIWSKCNDGKHVLHCTVLLFSIYRAVCYTRSDDSVDTPFSAVICSNCCGINSKLLLQRATKCGGNVISCLCNSCLPSRYTYIHVHQWLILDILHWSPLTYEIQGASYKCMGFQALINLCHLQIWQR